MVYEITDYADFKSAIDEICAVLSSRSVAPEKVFDCRLISFELIGNVLQHSGGKALLQVELKTESLRISVKAERVFCPPKKGECPEASAERGRGIYLVDCLSAERTYTEDGEIAVTVSLL